MFSALAEHSIYHSPVKCSQIPSCVNSKSYNTSENTEFQIDDKSSDSTFAQSTNSIMIEKEQGEIHFTL